MPKPKTIIIVLAVCGLGGLVLIGMCAGIIYLGFSAASDQVTPHVDRLFDEIAKDNFVESYESFTTSEFRSFVSREQYDQIGVAVREKLGRLESHSLRQFSMKTNNGVSTMEATLVGNFERGSGTIKIVLIDQDGEWKFQQFSVDSPVYHDSTP